MFVFSQSERLLSSNQKCLSRINRPPSLSSVKSDLKFHVTPVRYDICYLLKILCAIQFYINIDIHNYLSLLRYDPHTGV
jgi:hypothetical protein